jgi:hypothetical protein
MERLIEAALEATAEDFEELNSSDESTEIEARNLIFYFFTLN